MPKRTWSKTGETKLFYERISFSTIIPFFIVRSSTDTLIVLRLTLGTMFPQPQGFTLSKGTISRFIMVRMPSPINWYFYPTYNPVSNPTLHNSRRFIEIGYPNLVPPHGPTKFILLLDNRLQRQLLHIKNNIPTLSIPYLHGSQLRQ